MTFGINLNSNDAYHSHSTLYFQNSLQTLISLSAHHFCGLNKYSHFTPVDISEMAHLPESFTTLTITKLSRSRFNLLIMHALWFLFLFYLYPFLHYS